ncbi:DUF2442 domain-containing protein [Algoriphagus antarcticus]|uniref:Uncharacterized protein DUF2442 n=1 Tax=Algoriphagus antarcticus TaxID=238540 RepID=A0A3E0DJS1_9BACT|nr:DUF2442 domain-containing protein [Algoriphagus antarcticus]REG82314.1 uncharacterized protein DUF2442 [Algoriphagus antarcticus]
MILPKLKSNLAVDVCFTMEKMIIFLEDGREVSIPLEWFSSLREASTEDLNNWRLIGGGEGIHWESLDEDLLVSELVS